MAPKGSGVGDYIGMFACTAGLGLDEVIQKYKDVSVMGLGGLEQQHC